MKCVIEMPAEHFHDAFHVPHNDQSRVCAVRETSSEMQAVSTDPVGRRIASAYQLSSH